MKKKFFHIGIFVNLMILVSLTLLFLFLFIDSKDSLYFITMIIELSLFYMVVKLC